jgi:hypothetical protein
MRGISIFSPCLFHSCCKFAVSLGSTRSISLPWILFDLIWKIGVAPALRDLLPPMGSSRFVISRLYAIHIAADGIFKIHDISALRDSYRRP